VHLSNNLFLERYSMMIHHHTTAQKWFRAAFGDMTLCNILVYFLYPQTHA
jgi:hypothetical protein